MAESSQVPGALLSHFEPLQFMFLLGRASCHHYQSTIQHQIAIMAIPVLGSDGNPCGDDGCSNHACTHHVSCLCQSVDHQKCQKQVSAILLLLNGVDIYTVPRL